MSYTELIYENFNNNIVIHFKLYNLYFSWKVEKCDLEVNKKRWTFYIHPDAHTRHQLYDPNSTEREPGELTDLLIKQQPIKTDNVDTAENDTLQYVKKS